MKGCSASFLLLQPTKVQRNNVPSTKIDTYFLIVHSFIGLIYLQFFTCNIIFLIVTDNDNMVILDEFVRTDVGVWR